MTEQQPDGPQGIRYASINRTGEVGTRWDLVMLLPIAEVRREGQTVYARSVPFSEAENHEPIKMPDGGNLVIEAGDLTVALDEVDDYYFRTNGDVSLAPVFEVWLLIGTGSPTEAMHYIQAAARRLDVAVRLLGGVGRSLDNFWDVVAQNRLGAELENSRAKAIADMEVGVVSLSRAADMAERLDAVFQLSVHLSPASRTLLRSLRSFRNAYEHIEDRALGQVQGKPHPDALTVFNHRPLLEFRRIEYGNHSVTLSELGDLARDVRTTLKAAAADIGRAVVSP